MWHIVHFQKECQVVCPVIYAVRCRDIYLYIIASAFANSGWKAVG